MEILNEEPELVAVGDLLNHPDNVNEGDVEAVAQSIRTHGFYGYVVVQRSTRYVLAGNTRLKAAREVGLEKIPAVWLDVDDATAIRILLTDNRTTRLGHDDPARLLELLQSVAQQDLGLQGLGYDDEDLNDLLVSTGTLADQRSAFLAGLAGDGKPADVLGGEVQPTEEARQLTFAISDEQRTAVVKVLREVARSKGLSTQAEGLVALCAEWSGRQSVD